MKRTVDAEFEIQYNQNVKNILLLCFYGFDFKVGDLPQEIITESYIATYINKNVCTVIYLFN